MLSDTIKSPINNLMQETALVLNAKTDFLIHNTEFDYIDHYKNFLKFMAESGAIDYIKPKFLKNKIDDFGEIFKHDYIAAFDLPNTAWLRDLFFKYHLDIITETDKLKRKYCGNLFEIIGILCSNEYTLIDGYEYDEWCNGTDNDMQGVDGILKMSDNNNIKIPINAKHLHNMELEKFSAFQKLHSWRDLYIEQLNDIDCLTFCRLPIKGIILTDSYATDFISEQFPHIKIIDAIELCKKLGKYGKNASHISLWKSWYDFIK